MIIEAFGFYNLLITRSISSS